MLSWGFADRVEAENSFLYGTFVFFGTFSVYNLQRIFKVSQSSELTPWLVWVQENRKMITMLSVFSSIGALLSLLALKQINIGSLLILLLSGALGIFYVVKIGGRNLRAIPFLKIHFISITWSLLIAVLPWLNSDSSLSFIEVFSTHYIFILAVTIPFDIRDLKFDHSAFKTVPQVIGVRRAKQLSVVLLIAYTWLITHQFPGLSNSVWYLLTMLVIISLMVRVDEDVSDWYCAGLIDGSIGLLGLVYLLA